jgi:HTH-type transcriptional regulator/antitoxin HigA
MSSRSTIKPIRTKADHAKALAEIERAWDAKPGTPEGDRLDVLATLVDAYERQATPILPPDPIEAIKFRLEQQHKTRKDLEGIIGTRARVSEILGGRRSLSLSMIRGLHRELQIPLDVLVAEKDQERPRSARDARRRAKTAKKRMPKGAAATGAPKTTRGSKAEAARVRADSRHAG